MGQNNSSKTVRDKEKRSFLELITLLALGHCITWMVYQKKYLLRIPDFLDLRHQLPPVVEDRVHPVARQLGVVPVDHRATLWQILG